MNGLDIAIVATLAIFTLLSFYWGLIRQLLAIGGLLVGLLLATRLHDQATIAVSSLVQSNPDLAGLLAYLLIVATVSITVSLAASALRIFVGLLFLGWLDHVLGALLGLVQGVIVISVVLAVGTALPGAGLHGLVVESRLAPLFGLPVRGLLALLPERFALFNELIFR